MYLSQDTFRGTEFQYFFGYLPGGTFGDFRLPRVSKGDAFGSIFLTFGGPGALAEIALTLTRNLHLARLGGVQNAARDPLFSKALFQEGPRAGLFRILMISGLPLGSLGDHF